MEEGFRRRPVNAGSTWAWWPTYMGDKYSSVVGPAVGRAGQGALMYGWGRANHKQ